MKNALIIAVSLLSLAACDKKEAPPASDSAAVGAPTLTPPPAAPSAVAAAPVVVDVDSLPVEEDFEGDAEKEVTLATLNSQLDALDKEISAP